MKKTRTWILAILMVCLLLPAGLAGASGEIPAELPRNETLYYIGLQWSPVGTWNPFTDTSNNGLVFNTSPSRRSTVWEALYLYNA